MTVSTKGSLIEKDNKHTMTSTKSINSVLLVTIPQPGRYAYFNMGMGHIAKELNAAGFNIKILDLLVNHLPEEQITTQIAESECDIFLFSAMSTQYIEVIKLAALAKTARPECQIILGGHLATHNSHTILHHSEVDICVLGEGEVTIIELLSKWPDVNNVNGIAYEREGKHIKTAAREMVKDLDQLGMPAYELFDIPAYVKDSSIYSGPRGDSINIITTRGCPYNCNYCCKSFPGLRVKSLELIYKEIRFLRDNYGIGNILFADELTILNTKRGNEICSIMRELRMGWCCQGRANILDRPLLKEMKRSGCYAVGFGIESGSPKIIKNMNKRIDVKQSLAILQDTIKYGPSPIVQMMFGYTGENLETLKETEEFFKQVPYPSPGFFVTTPLPGTQLYNECRQRAMIGDEHDYLQQLNFGYMGDRNPTVNLTELPDDDFASIKRSFEKRVNRNFWIYGIFKPVLFVKVCVSLVRTYYFMVTDAVHKGIFIKRVLGRFGLRKS